MYEVIGDCRKLHNEELQNFYSPILRISIRWERHVAYMGEMRPLGTPGNRTDYKIDNRVIEVDFKETG
jgi:hypothetical protein